MFTLTEELLEKLKDWEYRKFDFMLYITGNYDTKIITTDKLILGMPIYLFRIAYTDSNFVVYIDQNNAHKNWEEMIVRSTIDTFKKWHLDEIKKYEEKFGKFEE